MAAYFEQTSDLTAGQSTERPETVVQTEPADGAGIPPAADTEVGAKSDGKSDAKSDGKTDAKSGTKSDAISDGRLDGMSGAKSGTKPDSPSGPKAAARKKPSMAPKAPRGDYVDWKTDCPADLRQFLFYLETIKGRSPRTVSAYYVDLRSFLRYLKYTHGLAEGLDFLDIPIADVSREMITGVAMLDVLEYFSFMMNERGNSPKTRARKVSALHTFYRYLEEQNIVKESPVKNLSLPSVPKTLPKYLTLEESRSLLNVSEGSQQQRDHCIFTLFLNCGMRLSELVGINLSDIRDNSIQITGKGNKQRQAYLNDACQEALKAYLPVRMAVQDAKDPQALFLSEKLRRRITPRGVQMIFDRYMASLGLADKGYTVHKLRHTAATLMYRYGHVDIRVLQLILGHESLANTEIYTHVANQQMEDAVNSSPLAEATGLFHRPGAESEKDSGSEGEDSTGSEDADPSDS